jgi:vancomycin resistance protein YoaR
MESTLRQPSGSTGTSLRVGIGLLAALVLVALLGAAALTTSYDGRILPGVRVLAVPVGGLEPEAARQRLAAEATTLGGQRAELSAGDRAWQPTLAELGVALEPGQLTQAAYSVGRLGGPIERLLVIGGAPFGSVDLAPAAVSRPRIAAWVDRAAGEVDRPARDARLEILPSGDVRLAPEQTGQRLDRAAATDELVAALDDWIVGLPSEGRRPIALALPTETVAPTILAADLQPARSEAERVLGRTATLRVDEFQRTLDRAALAALVTVGSDGRVARLDVDAGRLGGLVAEVAAATDRAPQDARLAIMPDGKVDFTADQPGRRLNQASATEQLRAAILGTGAPDVALPTEQIPARVRAADLAGARAAAERLLAAPIEVTAGDQKFTYQPSEIAPLLSISGGALTVDRQKVESGVQAILGRVERAPRHARLRIVGNDLQPIEEGVDGQRVDAAAAVAAITSALAKGERQVALPVQTVHAIQASDRAAFGPLQQIESASTTYAGGVAERTHNVELAASRLNGFVVPPGETFSFNAALGPTSVETGFQWAWGIAGGAVPQTVPSVGGGICQVATTLFHTVFWSGYQIEERNWHLYWIPKYGAPPKGLKGLDATVDYDSNTDLKWTNNSDTPVLIQATTNGAAITFSLHGQRPSWQVSVAGPQISGVVAPRGGVVRETTFGLPPGRSLAVEEAREGFTSRIVRTVTAPGAEPRVLDMVSTYQPSRNVILVGR